MRCSIRWRFAGGILAFGGVRKYNFILIEWFSKRCSHERYKTAYFFCAGDLYDGIRGSGCTALTDVYYIGSAEDWEKILNQGEALSNATNHCNYTAE